jgi:hypothetical protein
LLQLNISQAINREPDPYRISKLEAAIDESLRKSKGNPQRAFLALIESAETDTALADLIADVMCVALLRHFYRTCEYLTQIN